MSNKFDINIETRILAMEKNKIVVEHQEHIKSCHSSFHAVFLNKCDENMINKEQQIFQSTNHQNKFKINKSESLDAKGKFKKLKQLFSENKYNSVIFRVIDEIFSQYMRTKPSPNQPKFNLERGKKNPMKMVIENIEQLKLAASEKSNFKHTKPAQHRKKRKANSYSIRHMQKKKSAVDDQRLLSRPVTYSQAKTWRKELAYIESILKQEIAKLKSKKFYSVFSK